MPRGAKNTAITSDTDPSDNWEGSPLHLSLYLDERHQGAHGPQDGLSSKARSVLKKGMAANARGTPMYFNRLHMLVKNQASTDARPLTYDRDHVPPNGLQWAQRQQTAIAEIAAAVAAAAEAGGEALAGLAITVNVSSDDPVKDTSRPRPVDIIIALPWRADLTEDEARVAVIASDALDDVVSEIGDHFLSGITSVNLRSQYEGDGLQVISKLAADRDRFAVEHGDTFEAIYNEVVREGISAHANAAYLHFATRLDRANRALPAARRRDDRRTAIELENAVMALGGEARNEARINIRIRDAHGNLAETHAQLQLALGKVESDELKAKMSGEASGRALLGKPDPKRNGNGAKGKANDAKKPPWETRKWDAKVDKPCPGCKGNGHWWVDCKEFPKPLKKDTKSNAKKAVANSEGEAAPDPDGRSMKIKFSAEINDDLEQVGFKELLAQYERLDCTDCGTDELDDALPSPPPSPPPSCPPSPPPVDGPSTTADLISELTIDETIMEEALAPAEAISTESMAPLDVVIDHSDGNDITMSTAIDQLLATTVGTCAFPGCLRPAYIDATGTAHACCGRTCASALLVLRRCQPSVARPPSPPPMHVRVPPGCRIYVILVHGPDPWMLPGIYIGTMGAPDFLREVHIGQTPAVAGHPAVLGASDLDGAIARCREYHVPAMYRGSRLIHGLTVGELVPGAEASDAFPVAPAPAINIAQLESFLPPFQAGDLPSLSWAGHDLLVDAIFTLTTCATAGDVPLLRSIDQSSMRRALRILERATIPAAGLSAPAIKSAAWLATYAGRNAPVGGSLLRAACFATIRQMLHHCCAIELEIGLVDMNEQLFLSLIPRLCNGFARSVLAARDLADAVRAGEAFAPDHLIVVPTTVSGNTILDLFWWAPFKGASAPAIEPTVPSAPPSPPWELATPRSHLGSIGCFSTTKMMLATLLSCVGCCDGSPPIVDAVDAHQVLDNGEQQMVSNFRGLTYGGDNDYALLPVLGLLAIFITAICIKTSCILLSLFRSHRKQAEAVVWNRGIASIPPPRRILRERYSHTPSIYSMRLKQSYHRFFSGPSWLLLVYMLEWMIAWYFHKGSQILDIRPNAKDLYYSHEHRVRWLSPRRKQRAPRTPRVPNSSIASVALYCGGACMLTWMGQPPDFEA